MTCNLVAAWPFGIVCASDRRLTDLRDGKILTNRSTKMTIFGCADARGVITYNGIGMDNAGATPSDWLMDLAISEKLFDGSLSEVLEGIRIDAERRLKPLRAKYGPRSTRHSFILGVWHKRESLIYGISNYEGVDGREKAVQAQEDFTQSESLPTPGAELRIVAAGSLPPSALIYDIARAIKNGTANRIRASCARAVRSIAYGKGRGRGAVGASVQWAALGQEPAEVYQGHDVVGGAIAQETPNLINIGARVFVGGTLWAGIGGPGILAKDAYVGDARAAGIGRYNHVKRAFVFNELQCGICGAPWPASQTLCEVCLHDITSKRQK